MPDPKQPDPDGYQEVKQANLQGRVYNNGRVIIGSSEKVGAFEKIEVEISASVTNARKFMEEMIGLCKRVDGSY